MTSENVKEEKAGQERSRVHDGSGTIEKRKSLVPANAPCRGIGDVRNGEMAEGAESMRVLAKLGKAALCALLALALLGAAAGAETLRVGVRDDIINFGFYNETTGKYYGLEIDLAAELARRIGCDGVEYITVRPHSVTMMQVPRSGWTRISAAGTPRICQGWH